MKKCLIALIMSFQVMHASERPAPSALASVTSANEADCSSSSSDDDVFVPSEASSRRDYSSFLFWLQSKLQEAERKLVSMDRMVNGIKDKNKVLERSNFILKSFLTAPLALNNEASHFLIFNLLEELESVKAEKFALQRKLEELEFKKVINSTLRKESKAFSTDSLE